VADDLALLRGTHELDDGKQEALCGGALVHTQQHANVRLNAPRQLLAGAYHRPGAVHPQVGVQGEVTVEAGGLAEVPGLAGAIGRCALSRDFQANFRGILRNASTAGRRVTQITVRCGPTGIVGRFASLTLSEAESLWLNPVDAGNSSHQADVPH
jgi:hypothetical protein